MVCDQSADRDKGLQWLIDELRILVAANELQLQSAARKWPRHRRDHSCRPEN
jgi:hypothetical protein